MKRNVVIAAVVGGFVMILGGVATFFAIDNTIRQASLVAPPPPSPFAAFGPDCEIAPVNPKHIFVVAAIYHGDTLTNVQLADPDGLTTMVRVVVAAGSKPIVVLLQSEEPVIWDFEGAVERVARAIIVSGYRNRVAIRGLSAERIDFLKLARCPAQSIPFKADSEKRRDEILQGFFGRLPERIMFANAPNSIVLPDLKPGFPPQDGPERTAVTQAEKDLISYFPGGFRIVEAKSLVSTVEVLTPETFPVEAGLIQLERAGVIRPPRPEELDGFAEGFGKPFQSKLYPDYRLRFGFKYAILREAMLPPGLAGAHSKSFLVLSGVPAPRGSIRGCLAFMDGFRADDRVCYGDAWDALQNLKKLPEANAAKRCRLLDPPEDASVEAVSIYEPKGAKHSGNSIRVQSPVDVRVNKPGAVFLVLSAYEPALWRISASDATRIVGVILTGYYSSAIEGIAPDAPVIKLDYEGRRNQPAVDPACTSLHGYLGTAFRGAPGAMVLDRQVSALTGKGIDRLRGGYALDSVEIP